MARGRRLRKLLKARYRIAGNVTGTIINSVMIDHATSGGDVCRRWSPATCIAIAIDHAAPTSAATGHSGRQFNAAAARVIR